jgi:hypothetical protein
MEQVVTTVSLKEVMWGIGGLITLVVFIWGFRKGMVSKEVCNICHTHTKDNRDEDKKKLDSIDTKVDELKEDVNIIKGALGVK